MSHFMDEKESTISRIGRTCASEHRSAEDLNRDFKVIPSTRNAWVAEMLLPCYDAAHQAIDWDARRKPSIDDEKCVGCHLCLNVCPIKDASCQAKS